MNSLVKKILVPATVLGALFFLVPNINGGDFSEVRKRGDGKTGTRIAGQIPFIVLPNYLEKPDIRFNPKTTFYFGIGGYLRGDRDSDYSAVPQFKIGLTRDISKKVGLQIGVSHMSGKFPVFVSPLKEGELGRRMKMEMFQAELVGKYFVRGKIRDFYFGGGITYNHFQESEIRNWNFARDEVVFKEMKQEEHSLGAKVVVGLDMNLNKKKSVQAYLEGSLTGINIPLESKKNFIVETNNSEIYEAIKREGFMSYGGNTVEVGVRIKL